MNKTIEAAALKACPFCGQAGSQNFTCGPAVPDCPRCADIFGCSYCDIWFDTAEEWNNRTNADLLARVGELEAENARLKVIFERRNIALAEGDKDE
jgi:hypothetical protein